MSHGGSPQYRNAKDISQQAHQCHQIGDKAMQDELKVVISLLNLLMVDFDAGIASWHSYSCYLLK